MARRVEEDAEWDDEPWDSDEDDRASDEEDEPTIPCPYCRREIHEDSPQCPHCGQYISEEDARPNRQAVVDHRWRAAVPAGDLALDRAIDPRRVPSVWSELAS